MSYTTAARMYHIAFPDGNGATIVATCAEAALRELKYLELNRTYEGVRIGLMAPNVEIAICYEDPSDIDELFDDYLGIQKTLKEGFQTEIDDDGDQVVWGTAAAWARAFENDSPHIISSSFKDQESWKQ